MAIIDSGMATQKGTTLMEDAGKALDLSRNLSDQMDEFLHGGRPESGESKPQPVLAPLEGVSERLDKIIYNLENATKMFHEITSKIM